MKRGNAYLRSKGLLPYYKTKIQENVKKFAIENLNEEKQGQMEQNKSILYI